MSNVPKLRFPEFVGEWEKEKARNIFFSISDKNHSGELPVISVTQNRGTVARQDLNIDIKYDKTNLINYKRIRLNNFVISLRSFQGGIDRSNHDGLVSPAYTIFDFIKSDRHNPHFFEHIFKSKNFINRLVTLIYGIRDGKAIGFTDFSSLNVSVPLKAEQTKIANFFALIDKKITKQDDKVAALEQYKKGLMQRIFSREIRFKDNNGNDYPEWENTSIGQLLKIRHGKDQKAIECANGVYPILATSGQIGKTNVAIFNKESVLIGRKGTINKPQYMDTPFWTVDTLFYSEIFDGNHAKFVYYLFLTINWLLYNEASGVPSLSASIIVKIKADIPCFPEQTKIANFLSLYDRKIEKEKAKLETLREQKKGLLQQMFV